MTDKVDLPSYIEQADQENYNQEFNQTLREWFNSDGFVLPSLTAAEVISLLALPPVAPKVWFNSTLGKMQILVNSTTVETVTSV